MSREALLPCPFCGWKLAWPPTVLEGAVECPDCFATGPTEEAQAEAIAAWNTRHTPPVSEVTEAAHDLLDALTGLRLNGVAVCMLDTKLNAAIERMSAALSPEQQPQPEKENQ